MAVDPDVIDALQAIVEREPTNLALGLHLAQLLLDDGRAREALDLIVAVLAVAPADPAALALRAEAARLVTSAAAAPGPLAPAAPASSPGSGAPQPASPPGLRLLDGGRAAPRNAGRPDRERQV